jgi:hypothetical protein
MNYINKKIFGLPKPKHGVKSHKRKNSLPPYVHHVVIGNNPYFKVHIARNSGAQSKIKYFKTLKVAEIFVELLKLNPYL